MTAYTVLGKFDWGGDLLVEMVGVDWSEKQIELEAAVLGPNGWCSTFEAESASEAFQIAGQTTCDETPLDVAARLFDVWSERQLVYEGRRLAKQKEEQ
ncbi:hypothetical protein ACIQWZ_36090 [Streptomyces sp. NPDC098077]|uniref:hypothetical protein n=1 Tax=Streptomyces sp. NPDC098077 TaxID=3366093 RepID=UPI003808A485